MLKKLDTKKTGTKKANKKVKKDISSLFPTNLTVGDMKLKVIQGDFSIQDFSKILEKDKEVYIGAYWSERLIKSAKYVKTGQIPKELVPKRFPNDLDLAQIGMIADRANKAYFMSVYTDVVYSIHEEDLKENDLGYRVSNGMEYAIYVEV